MQQQPGIWVSDLDFEVDAARILSRVGLHAGPGELIALIGPNGAGKSTLLRVIAGLLRRSGGEVTVDGKDVSALGSKELARRLAFVTQQAPETHGFTSLEVVLTARYPHLGRFEIEGQRDQEIALAAMAETDTAEFASRPATTLSGGERQRVFVARGLAQQPGFLLLDEPVANLDVRYQIAVFELLQRVVDEGVTVIIACHDLRLAARYCGRLVLLKEGRIIADGKPEEVLTPANLAGAFSVRAVVQRDPMTGGLAVDFHAAPPGAVAGRSAGRVHVLCGAGSGARLLFELVEAGYDVSAGPLAEGDVDSACALALGTPFLSAPGVAPVDDETHAAHLRLAADAACVILCDMPVGPANVRDLAVLAAARRVMVLETSPIAGRDYTGGEAARALSALPRLERYAGVDEVIAALEAGWAATPATATPANSQEADR